MPAEQTRTTIDALRTRRCLSCGHASPRFQTPVFAGPYACPRCNCDLYARPPRSYAELEGFVPEDLAATPAAPRQRSRFALVCERFTAVGVLAVVVALAVWAILGV